MSRVTALILLMVTIAAGQPVETFRVSKSPMPDVDQQTLHAVSPESKQTTEVFPGNYVSPFGQAVLTRIDTLMGRVDEADRNALIASRARAGFDRSFISWRSHPNGRMVALAVRYFRDVLWKLELEMTDDYGRADPVDPARYEFFAIAVCARSGADGWTCREEQLAEVAARLKVPVPQDRPGRIAAAETLVERVLAERR
jgi:hypothetical protein